MPVLVNLGAAALNLFKDLAAAGKTITWGDGTWDNTFALIILHENIGTELAHDHPPACGLLAHEIAHAHDNASLLRTFGKQDFPSVLDSGETRTL